MITIVILTYNEEIHILRCLNNVKQISKEIFIIDSFSNDKTLEIAQQHNTKIFQNRFISQAQQLEWAMTNCCITTDWILRVDADEYFTEELIEEIKYKIKYLTKDINGVFLKRRHYFMDTWIKYGGRFPLLILRLWRKDKAKVEAKWMDEQMILKEGKSVVFENHFIDHNLNNLTWMIQKHNNYATREAIELLNKEYKFIKDESFLDTKQALYNSTHRTRFFKDFLYRKEFLLIRSLMYFLYRYFFLLGFLDGRKGLIYHFLQGFWYRFLCDAKIIEIKYISSTKNISIQQAIEEYSGYKIN